MLQLQLSCPCSEFHASNNPSLQILFQNLSFAECFFLMASMVCSVWSWDDLLVLMFIVHWFTAHKTLSARGTFSARPTNRCVKKNCCKHTYQPTYFIIYKIKKFIDIPNRKMHKSLPGFSPRLGRSSSGVSACFGCHSIRRGSSGSDRVMGRTFDSHKGTKMKKGSGSGRWTKVAIMKSHKFVVWLQL